MFMANIKSTLPMFSQNWNTYYKHVKYPSRTIPKISLEPSIFFCSHDKKIQKGGQNNKTKKKKKKKKRYQKFLAGYLNICWD